MLWTSRQIAFALLLWLTNGARVHSFVTPYRATGTSSTTELYGNTKVAPSVIPTPTDLPYGEESRKYRRTVFTHDDWRKFRDPNRFGYSIRSIVNSGIYKGIGREVGLTTTVATLVVLFNIAVGGSTDLEGVAHAAPLGPSPWLPVLGLPLAPFTLSSSSLGLLLGMLG